MEDLYGFHYSAGSSMAPSTSQNVQQLVLSGSSSTSDAVLSEVAGFEEDQLSKALRAKIASHPLFPKLLDAYIDCHKMGESQEMAKLLDEIGGHNSVCQISAFSGGADHELDDFMVTYLNLLVKFKSDLSKHFDEATAFLNEMQTQLNSICNGSAAINNEATRSSDEDFGREEKEALECKRKKEERELKDELLRRYSGYICSLKHEFSKRKQKKEKIPKEASQILLAWWNIHFKWPYPTETDKVALSEWTGLDQKQINNWFTNHRKRHRKPTEVMQASVVDGLYGPLSQLHE